MTGTFLFCLCPTHHALHGAQVRRDVSAVEVSFDDEDGEAMHGGPHHILCTSSGVTVERAGCHQVIQESDEVLVPGCVVVGGCSAQPAEGHPEQVRVLDGVGDVGLAGSGRARQRCISIVTRDCSGRIDDGGIQFGNCMETDFAEECVLVSEVVIRSAWAHPDALRDSAQRQVFETVRFDRLNSTANEGLA